MTTRPEFVEGVVVLLALSSILYALLFASVAGALLRRRDPRVPVGLWMPLYVLLSFLWVLGQFSLVLKQPGLLPQDLLANILLYALIPLALLFLALTRQFLARQSVHDQPKDWQGLGWPWWVLGLVWLAAVILVNEDLLAAVGLSLNDTMPALTRQWLAFIMLVLGWGFFMAVAALRTIRAYFRSRHPQYRNRITYWVMVLILTASGVALFLSRHPEWGSLVGLLGCSGAAYLVMAYHLPDARRLAREALSHLIVALVLVVFCAGGFLLGYYALQAVPGYPPWVIGGALALLLAIVIHPLLDRLQSLMAGKAPGSGHDASHIVSEYTALISNILDLEELSIVALGLAREAMETGLGAVYLVEDEGAAKSPKMGKDPQGPPPSATASTTVRTRGGGLPTDSRRPDSHRPEPSTVLRCVASTGRGLVPIRLSPESPVAEVLSGQDRPLTQYDLDFQPRFHRLALQEREALASLGMDVYIPIHAEGEWIGLLALGPRRSGRPYTRDDLDLLARLADQMGIALYNARLFETMKAQLAARDLRNEELRAARQDLVRLSEGQSAFLRLAAREMQPPLGGIKGYLDALREMLRAGSLTAERGEEMMEGIGRSVQRLEEMAQTLTGAATMELDLPGLELQAVRVDSVVQAAAERWSGALAARHLTFTTQNLEPLPAVMADEERLVQVFEELIQNACKFTPDGGQIQVRGLLRDRGPSERTVEIVVADTGVGIARSDLARVFEPFVRRGEVVLHGAGQTQFGAAGPGLGLSRVQAIVQAHGGRVQAESPGYDEANCPGTEVRLVLPVRAGI